MNYFSRTKESCYHLIKEIQQHQTRIYANSDLQEEQQIMLKTLFEIYSINASVLYSLNQIKENILEGKINNYRTYWEADLKMVDVILSIYSQYVEKSTAILISDKMKLQQLLENQLEAFQQLLNYFPEDLAINVKRKPNVITNISLDYYQFIYLALSHGNLKLQGINLNLSIKKLAEQKTVS